MSTGEFFQSFGLSSKCKDLDFVGQQDQESALQ
jgi:hypothetical protein